MLVSEPSLQHWLLFDLAVLLVMTRHHPRVTMMTMTTRVKATKVIAMMKVASRSTAVMIVTTTTMTKAFVWQYQTVGQARSVY
jgi:hypothetical protein